MHPNLVVLFLSMLLGIQPVTTDLYLPALPALTDSLGASMGHAQLTLTALLLAFGTSQLVWGPLSDRYGRRPILIAGLAAYCVASLGSVFTGTMEALIGWRALQGAAMGASVMCARAMTRDLFVPTDAARVMSKGLSGLGLIALLTGPLGGLATNWLGWRAALAMLGLFAAATLVLVYFKFEETLPASRQQRVPMQQLWGQLWRTCGQITRSSAFWSYAVLVTCSYGGLFTYLASSSFVYIKVLGLSKMQYGLIMALISLCYIIGTFICRALLSRYGLQRTVRVAGVVTALAGGMMALVWVMDWANVLGITLPFGIFVIGHGIHQPCGQAGCAAPFPQAAGTASALSGFCMMVVAFANGAWIGQHMDGTADVLVHGVALWSVPIVLTAWVLVQRYGKPPAH
jgi:MFS transporter, DHA1 family, multidrug resistance protein